MLALLIDYSHRRSVFGKKLIAIPLHVNKLAELEMIYRGNLLFLLQVGRYL